MSRLPPDPLNLFSTWEKNRAWGQGFLLPSTAKAYFENEVNPFFIQGVSYQGLCTNLWLDNTVEPFYSGHPWDSLKCPD